MSLQSPLWCLLPWMMDLALEKDNCLTHSYWLEVQQSLRMCVAFLLMILDTGTQTYPSVGSE